jgi:hypothetical protein
MPKPKKTTNGRGGARSNAREEDEEEEGDSALDDDTREEIGRMISAGFSSMFARKLPAAIEGVVGKRFKSLESLLKKRLGDDEGDDEEDEGEEEDVEEEEPAPRRGQAKRPSLGGGKGAGKAGAKDPEVRKLRKMVDELTNSIKQRDSAAQAQELVGTVREALTSVGVEPNRLRGAIAVVKDSIKWTDDGELVFVAKRDGYEEDIDVATGIKEWAGTDEGKSYLAAPTVRGGAGTRTGTAPAARSAAAAGRGASAVVGRGAGVNRPQGDPKAAKAARVAELQAKLSDQVGSLLGSGNVDLG